MTDQYCPSCGKHGTFRNALDDSRLFQCPCGMMWRTVTNKDTLSIKDPRKAEIR